MEQVKLLVGGNNEKYFEKAANELTFGKVDIVRHDGKVFVFIQGADYGDICRVCTMAGYFQGAEMAREIFKPTKV